MNELVEELEERGCEKCAPTTASSTEHARLFGETNGNVYRAVPKTIPMTVSMCSASIK